MSNPISDLSERQRELLEAVASGMTASKDLAKSTGLSPGYIDKALSQAAKALGCRDRITASRYYMNLQVSDLPSDRRAQDLLNVTIYEPSEPASAFRQVSRMFIAFFRGPKLGGEQHKLRWDQAILQILRVAAVGLITILTLVLFILGFFRTFS